MSGDIRIAIGIRLFDLGENGIFAGERLARCEQEARELTNRIVWQRAAPNDVMLKTDRLDRLFRHGGVAAKHARLDLGRLVDGMPRRDRLGRADFEKRRYALSIGRRGDRVGNDRAGHRTYREDHIDGVVAQRSINVTGVERHDGDLFGRDLVLF